MRGGYFRPMTMKRQRLRERREKSRPDQPIPVDPARWCEIDVDAAIRQIGDLERTLAGLEADLDKRVAAMRIDAETRSRPLSQALETLRSGVQAWCNAHREDLLGKGRGRTVHFTAGAVRWRRTPPKVVIDADEATAIAALKRAGLKQFIRLHEEIARDLILADPKAVRRVPIIQVVEGERFEIKPTRTDLLADRPKVIPDNADR